MRIDELNRNHIIAEEGKVLRRIVDSAMTGKEVYLGYNYYLNGEPVEPYLELPEHYEEIEEEIGDDDVILDEEKVLEELETLEEIEGEPIPETKRRITVADYIKLESLVRKLTEKIGGVE